MLTGEKKRYLCSKIGQFNDVDACRRAGGEKKGLATEVFTPDNK